MSIKLLNFSTPKSNQKIIIINAGLFIALVLVVIAITTIYISQEKYFYYWDFANYSHKTQELASAFANSIPQGFKYLNNSLSQDYNAIPCLPLVPFTLLFGESRLVFILSCALVYIVPFSLIAGTIATKLIAANPLAVFWSTAFLTLLLPQTWIGIFRGYPDLGAAVIMGLTILVYLKEMRLKYWWQIPSLGFLLGLAILFRRHYAYSARAFFVAMIFQGLILFCTQTRNSRKQLLQNLTRYGIAIGLVALTSLLTMYIIAPEFTSRAFNVNYGNLYSSYESPIGQVFYSLVRSNGLIILLMSILGYGIGTLTRTFLRPKIYFLILFAFISIMQWMLLARLNFENHYATHFLIFFVLGIEALIITTILILTRKVRLWTLMLIITFLIANCLAGLTPIGTWDNLSSRGISWKDYVRYRPVIANSYPPLIRQDYEQVSEMIQYLRKVTPQSEPIYVAASSNSLSADLITWAEMQLYGKENRKLKILESPMVDSRDFYPLRYLPVAQYVLVANPFQYHLSPQEHDVVKVVVDCFQENCQFAQDFQKMPQSFKLQEDITVDIYQRITPTSLKTILNSLKLMQEKIQPKPGSEIDWLVAESKEGDIGMGRKNDQKNVQIHTSLHTKSKSILYYGKVPEYITLKGIFHASNCSGMDQVSLKLMTLNNDGDVINSTEDVLFSVNQSTDFSLSLTGKDAAYLYLTLTPELSSDLNSKIDPICYVKLDNLNLIN